jgi:hypothetical protein
MPDEELNESERRFLARLAEEAGGDTSRQVSMYAVGASLGMDRETASLAAQALIGLELAEIRSLSGGIGISARGIEAAGPAAVGGAAAVELGAGPLLDARASQAVEQLMNATKARAGSLGLDGGALAELMSDLKTLGAQLESPRPKTAVVRETLRSIAGCLDRAGERVCLAKVEGLIGREPARGGDRR